MLKNLANIIRAKILNIAGDEVNPATDTKLNELKTELQNIYGAVDGLELITGNIKIEAEQINLNTDDLESKTQSIRDQLDVLLSTRTSEATAQLILLALGQGSGTSILNELETLVSTVATEATLQQIEGHLDTVETKLQSIIDRLDVNLSTRASENTLQEVRDTIGQESGSTVLSRLQDIWDKLVELFETGIGKIKIWDGTSIATITDAGAKKRLDVSIQEPIAVNITGAVNALPLQIQYDKSFSAINANEWQEIAIYNIPSGYNFVPNSFRCHSETAGEKARVIIETIGGTFDCPTDTFTDEDSTLAPQFNSGVYIEVTSAVGSVANDTVTITYTNEHGITGRTCNILIPKSSSIGTHIEGVLEGDDIGIRDITNVTHSATAQVGAYNLEMYYSVFQLLMSSSGTMYQGVAISATPVRIPENSEIILQVLAGTKTSYNRNLSLIGTLEPIL